MGFALYTCKYIFVIVSGVTAGGIWGPSLLQVLESCGDAQGIMNPGPLYIKQCSSPLSHILIPWFWGLLVLDQPWWCLGLTPESGLRDHFPKSSG